MPEVCPSKVHPKTRVEVGWQGVKPPFPGPGLALAQTGPTAEPVVEGHRDPALR
jgi:hypothetical protein